MNTQPDIQTESLMHEIIQNNTDVHTFKIPSLILHYPRFTFSLWCNFFVAVLVAGFSALVAIYVIPMFKMCVPKSEVVNVKVKNVKAKSVRETSLTLTWSEAEYNGDKSYEVHWSTEDFKESIVTEETSLSLKELTPGQKYKFTVALVVSDECGNKQRFHSKAIKVAMKPSRPGKMDMNESSLQLNYNLIKWENATGNFDEYLVIFEDCTESEVVRRVTYGKNPSYYIYDLEADLEYTLKVFTVSGDKKSEPNIEKIKLPNFKDKDFKVSNLQAKSIGNTYVSLQWKEPNYKKTRYFEVTWAKLNSDQWEVIQVDTNGSWMLIDNLMSGQDYKFRVVSVLPKDCEKERRIQSDIIQVRTRAES